jgi:hypothetical protein
LSTTWTSSAPADWLIDLGPDGGDAGGEVVAYGTPEEVMLHASSHTALALRDYAAQMGVVHTVREFGEMPLPNGARNLEVLLPR